MTVRVAIQQQLRLFREGLALLLAEEQDLTVVGTAVTSAELFALAKSCKLDVVLMEVDAHDWDPCRVAATLRKRQQDLRFVGLFDAGGDADAARAQRAGLCTVVRRGDGIGPILEAVRTVHRRPRGHIDVPPSAKPPGSLTAREVDVLALVGSGWTSREISDRLAITRKTVENHKQRIFDKLGVQNQAHAVAVAMRRSILSADGVIDLRDGARP